MISRIRIALDRFTPQEGMSFRIFLKGLPFVLLSGILLGLSFPTTDMFPLAWIAMVPLMMVCFRQGPLYAWLFSLLGGLTFWLLNAFWMHTFHPLSLFTAIPALALYFAFPFLFEALWRKRVPGLSRFSPLVFIVAWLAVEYFRSTGFLAFTWGVLGYSQYNFLPVIQIADIFGVTGVSLLVILVNTALALSLSGQHPSRRRFLQVTAGLTAAALLYGAFRLLQPLPAGGQRVALVQGFTDPAVDWRGWFRTMRTIRKIDLLTRLAAMKDCWPDTGTQPVYPSWFRGGFPDLFPPDLVIWSETLSARRAMAYYRQLGAMPKKQVDSLAKRNPYYPVLLMREIGVWFRNLPGRLGTAVVLTAPDRKNNKSFNSAFLVDGSGRLLDQYNKIKLVPFGEWFPYDIPFVKRILASTIASNFTPGERFVVFRLYGIPFSVVICFEDIFGDICRMFVRGGAGYLVNTTNDYWSRSLKAQIQHYSISVFRAVENRRFLVRAANTGVTAIVDAHGKKRAGLENNIVGILQVTVPDMSGEGLTFFTRHGDLMGITSLWLLVAVILFLLPAESLRRRMKIYYLPVK